MKQKSSPREFTPGFPESCWPIIVLLHSIGGKNSIVEVSQSFNVNWGRWATNSNSLPWPVSTRSITACFTGARLSRSRNGGLRGTARGGVRGRKAWLQRDQTSARSGHRLLRRCRSGYRCWPLLHHGVARFNRTRTVSLNRAETASSAAAALTDSRLAALCAEAAQHAFANYQGRFDEITRRARERFLAHDLKGSYADSAERLHLYGHVLANLTTQITDLMGPRLRERNVWTAT